MCRAGAQPHRPDARVGERALRRDPQHRLGSARMRRAGAQEMRRRRGGVPGLDAEEADPPHEAVALQLAASIGP